MIYIVSLNPSIDYHMEVDSLKIGETNRSHKERIQIGGKGINVSIILNNLKQESTLLGFLGGFTGHYIKDHLKGYDYVSDQILETPATTRINIKLKTTAETEVNAEGEQVPLELITELENQLKQVTPNDLVIMSGSLASGMEADWYLKMAKDLESRQIPYIVDIANSLVLDIAKHQPLLLKPNRDELEAIFNVSIDTDEELIQYGKKLIELGAQHVIVSLGGQGSLFLTKDDVYRAQNPQGKVIHTVGAGDSMIGGFTQAWVNHQSPVQCYQQAVAAGSGTAYSETLADSEIIHRLTQEVKVEKQGA